MDSKELRSLMEAYQQVCAPQEVEEVYKGKHGQSDKEYADSRSPGGKMVSGDSKGSGAEYTHGRRVKAANPGMQPDVGGKTKPKSQGKMDAGTRADLQYRKANLKKEEVEQVDEADSLAAMAARREKRLARQRKQMGTSSTGQDFGHDYGISSAERKKRQQAEFDKFVGRGKKTTKEEVENVEEGLRDKVGEKVKKHINKYAYKQGIHNNPGWLRKPEKRAALNKAVRDDIKKNPKAAVQYAAGEVKRKVKEKLRKEEYLDETGKRDAAVRDRINMFKGSKVEYTPPKNWDPEANRGKGATVSPKQAEKRRRKALRSEEFDAFDVILEFLIDEEIAQDIQEANWIMANAITEEQIDEILGMFKKKPEKKTEYAGRSMKKPVPDEKKGYTVDKSRPEVSVSTYGKGGKTDKFKTRGRV